MTKRKEPILKTICRDQKARIERLEYLLSGAVIFTFGEFSKAPRGSEQAEILGSLTRDILVELDPHSPMLQLIPEDPHQGKVICPAS